MDFILGFIAGALFIPCLAALSVLWMNVVDWMDND